MVQWLEIQSSNVVELEKAAKEFNIHPLAMEDCFHRDQRSKIEDFQSHQFLVWFVMASSKLYEIQFIIHPTAIVMVPHDPPPTGNTWKEFFNFHENQMDVWHMLYHVLDRATDITWAEVRGLFAKIDAFEEQIFDSDCNPQSIMALKKHLIHVDYSIGHLPSVVQQLQNFCRPSDDLTWKLRDLHDHCERIYQNIALYRSQIDTAIDLFWGHQSYKINKHIKKITLLASIALPLTFWCSFWGMNFAAIPFHSHYFFFLALGLMVGSVILVAYFLKKKGYWQD